MRSKAAGFVCFYPYNCFVAVRSELPVNSYNLPVVGFPFGP